MDFIKKFKKEAATAIKKSKIVRLKRMKNVIEIVSIDKKQSGFDQIQKISKTEYVVKETGEIHEYTLSENKSQNIGSLKKSFRKIRDLINNNFEGKRNELHITLTYRPVDGHTMKDIKKLYVDFKKFWLRFKYRYGRNIDYLSVVEPHHDGAWHCHVLFRFNDLDTVFIQNDEIEKLWSHGWTTTRRTHSVDNMGAYITAYLTDVEVTAETMHLNTKDAEIKIVESKEGVRKGYIKGARVHFYPTDMNILRSSKGIVHPDIEEMSYKNAKKIVGERTPTYSTTTVILDEDDKPINKITYEHYNLKRAKTEATDSLENYI